MSGGRWPDAQRGFGSVAPKPRMPAYAADALQLRAGGMAVTLLVVGLDHFNAGRTWQTIRGALRVVAPADVRDAAALDWRVAAGLNVLVEHWPEIAEGLDGMGLHAARQAAQARRDALLVALHRAGAQSLWLACEVDGLPVAQRVEITPAGAVVSGVEQGTVRTLPAELADLHDAQMVMGEGIFGAPEAVPARINRLVELFGSDEAGLQQVAAALGVDARAAA